MLFLPVIAKITKIYKMLPGLLWSLAWCDLVAHVEFSVILLHIGLHDEMNFYLKKPRYLGPNKNRFKSWQVPELQRRMALNRPSGYIMKNQRSCHIDRISVFPIRFTWLLQFWKDIESGFPYWRSVQSSSDFIERRYLLTNASSNCSAWLIRVR